MVNIVLIILIISGLYLFLRYILKNKTAAVSLDEKNQFQLDYLVKGIRESFSEIASMNLTRLNLNMADMEKRKKNRNNLRRALKTCGLGDAGARNYIKDYMKSLLQKKFNINERTINQVLPFEEEERMSAEDKFDILLYLYEVKKNYGGRALEELIRRYHLDDAKKDNRGKYEITKEDIDLVYEREKEELDFSDKLEIVTQRLFSMDKGNGPIDALLYQKIDGVSGGVSGLSEDMYYYGNGRMDEKEAEKKLQFTYDAVWIMFRGISLHLKCLSFGTEKELKRVCKNIYRYDAPGQMSQATGYIVNNLKSGARVSDIRPPFGGSWAFWIRMFESAEKKAIKQLYPQKGNETLEKVLQYMIGGEQTTVISGQQGSGKTTALEALVDYIAPFYNIRTIELTFELRLQNLYPDRNIAAMRETKTVSTEQAIEFSKKTDADVVIFGEIAKEAEGEKVIKITQAGTRFTLSSQHGMTTKSMIDWFRNALLHTGFRDEEIAERQVVEAIRFDVHAAKIRKGDHTERVIERITEIIPITEYQLSEDPMTALKEYLERKLNGRTYKTADILEYQDGEYKLLHPFSPDTCRQILSQLPAWEQENFKSFMGIDEMYLKVGKG